MRASPDSTNSEHAGRGGFHKPEIKDVRFAADSGRRDAKAPAVHSPTILDPPTTESWVVVTDPPESNTPLPLSAVRAPPERQHSQATAWRAQSLPFRRSATTSSAVPGNPLTR